MKEYLLPLLGSNGLTFVLSYLYHRKARKADLEDRLLARINDLSEKYLFLNEQYTNLADKYNKVERENRLLKKQLTCLRKKGKI